MATKKASAKKTALRSFDAAAYLTNDDAIAEFLTASIEEAAGDPTLVLHALNTVLRAKKRNLAELARDCGITRSGLYEVLGGKRNPSFATVLRLLGAMDMTVKIDVARSKASARQAA